MTHDYHNTPAQYVEALLIGGPHDGQRVQVMDGQPVLAMPSPVAIPDSFPQRPPMEPEFAVEHYHRSGFGMAHNGRRGEFLLYVHESLPSEPMAAIQMLYEGYRKPRETVQWGHDLDTLPRKARRFA